MLLRPSIARELTPGRYQCLRALGYYHWPLDHVVRQFKYGHPKLSATLASWFVQYSGVRSQQPPDCLLPVPISALRYAKRQYHQTLLLSQHLSAQLGIPVMANWASRRGWQVSQQSLGRRERLTNLKRAYQLNRSDFPDRVAIVDDVITTGATAATLSRLLHRCSAHTHIEVWALAVTPVSIDEQILLPARELNDSH